MTIRVIKKNGKIQEWLPEKIEKAINQSAKRTTLCKLTEKQNSEVIRLDRQCCAVPPWATVPSRYRP